MKVRIFLLTLLFLLLPTAAPAQEVATSAAACAVIDARSGSLLLSHQADTPLPMASTTKVMTALLAIEQGDLTAPVTVSRNAFGVPGTSMYLSEGETLTLEQLLHGLMLVSGNDAAVAIAEHIGGSVERFCAMMTARAQELGCRDTVFLTPHGLPCEGHYTTARDLALIAREAMQHEVFRRIVSTTRAKVPWPGRTYDRILNNKNRLLTTYDGATGIKTGYTRKAGRCLVFGAQREGMEIIGVVLNCPDWFDEAARLMDQAFAAYEPLTLLHEGEAIRTLPVDESDGSQVEVLLTEDLTALVPRNALPQLVIELPESLTAPVTEGQVVGQAQLWWMNEPLCTVKLAAARAIPRANWLGRWQKVWGAWLMTE